MTKPIFSLLPDEQITPVISRRHYDELDLLVVGHPRVRAALSLQGAHLLSWQPQGEDDDVLWLSPGTPFKTGIPLRGGVPLCWPWFGAPSQSGLPSHGFARNLLWSLSAHHENEQGVVLTLVLHSSEASRRYWPHDFTLYARFKLGENCEIELEAHGEFTHTAALHSYFTIGDISTVQVSGLGKRFIDKVAAGKEGGLENGIQQFKGRVDRVYLAPEACSRIDDPVLARNIEIIHHHHSNVVAWNPGADLAASMHDIPDDGWRHFVCVETACVTQPQAATYHSPSRLSCTLQVKRGSRQTSL